MGEAPGGGPWGTKAGLWLTVLGDPRGTSGGRAGKAGRARSQGLVRSALQAKRFLHHGSSRLKESHFFIIANNRCHKWGAGRECRQGEEGREGRERR